MKNQRKQSNITVSVIDLTGPLAQALEEFNQARLSKGQETAIKVSTSDYGYVQTEQGMFCLCRDGAGHDHPITADKKLDIDLYPEWAEAEAIIPSGILELSDMEIMMLPSKREEQLEDFIRTFGGRLEANYEVWLNCLTKARPMAANFG